jgi:catechol 2,3-dioxygenase-like lactoylglutathione lyase family enzyme
MSYDPASLAGRSLTQVGLTVRNLERARGFYRDILGLPLLFEAGGMLFFQLGGLRLMVGQERIAGQSIGGSLLYFDAPDIDELGRALEAKGVAFVSDAQVVQRTATHDLKLREFLDPDGNALAIMGLVAH